MRKNVLSFSAAILVVASLASCGGSMTEAEIQAEAKKSFDEKQTELAEEAITDCDDNKEMYTMQALDSLKNAGGM
ncbi:MAG: hypothetical protein ACRBFS_17580 [Aureispira sp.]